MTKPIKKPTTKSYKRKPKGLKLTKEIKSQNDIYARITNKIIEDLEKGNLTWRKPWHSENLSGNVMRPLRWNNIPYTGINTLVLWGTAAEKGYTFSNWMTFDQATKLKANVRRGEKATTIVKLIKSIKEDADENGETKIIESSYLISYPVFNAAQIDGLPEAFYKVSEPAVNNPEQRREELENFFTQTKADIYTGTKASYNQGTDRIQMPPFESFESAVSFYATLAHEVTHWTKHAKRLNRDLGRKQYGDEGYAKEELVAELGACFLAADLGFEPMPEEQHAAYIKSWLKALKDDKRLIFSAASLAQKAVEYIHGLQPILKPEPV